MHWIIIPQLLSKIIVVPQKLLFGTPGGAITRNKHPRVIKGSA